MREIAPGLWHWVASHDAINLDVSTYYLASERVLLDPMLPPPGLQWFESVGVPEHILLTNRHHDRQSWVLKQSFGCEIHCVSNGVYEIADRGPVTPFEFGDTLPGGIVAHEVGAICPDETALHIPAHRALACADGVVEWPGSQGLTFVPDQLMDDPADTKVALSAAYRSLLELDFDLLLLAHGEPVSDGRSALAAFTGAAG
jgi:glyoxylase-like metal-dependent hydrolase (beta-lactamase superfamily II)